jgi:hypothetical protein
MLLPGAAQTVREVLLRALGSWARMFSPILEYDA